MTHNRDTLAAQKKINTMVYILYMYIYIYVYTVLHTCIHTVMGMLSLVPRPSLVY